MQHVYNREVTENPFNYNHWLPSAALPSLRRLRGNPFGENIGKKWLELAGLCLSCLAIGTMFLAGIYFFLVQLAAHGW